jgi:hypothetical protein
LRGEFPTGNDFSISNGFWNLARHWKIAQGDFGGILMWGFFPKLF